MVALWTTPDKVDFIRLISQWIAVVSTIIALIFGMRSSTLKAKMDSDKNIKQEQTVAELKGAREQIKDLERAIEIRPFPFRLKEVLDKIDPKILSDLQHGQTNFNLKLPHNHYSRLQDLCAEKDSVQYIHINPLSAQDNFEESGPSGLLYGLNISISPKLLPALNQ